VPHEKRQTSLRCPRPPRRRPLAQPETGNRESCDTGRYPLCADANGDGKVDVTDPVQTLNWLFMGGKQPSCCADSAQGPFEWVMNQAIPMPRRSIGRFQDNGDGTVTDLLTNLIWQQRTADKNGDNVIDQKDKMNFAEAESYVQSLSLGGRIDWRVPSMRELQSIFDRTKETRPSIDPIFTDTPYEFIVGVNHEKPNYWASNTTSVIDKVFGTCCNYSASFEFLIQTGLDPEYPAAILRAVTGP